MSKSHPLTRSNLAAISGLLIMVCLGIGFSGCREIAEQTSSQNLQPGDSKSSSTADVPVATQPMQGDAGVEPSKPDVQELGTNTEQKPPTANSDTNAVATASTDWLFFRGDAAGRAFVPQTKLPANLDVIWEYWEPKCSYESSVVVCEGQVVVADLDGMVRCLNLADKKLLWKTPTKFGFTASPSIRKQKIYIGDNDGMFRCLDLKTGTIDWEFQANAQIDSSANFIENQVIFGSQDANVYCLNETDGTLKWKHTIDDQVRCSIVIEGQRTAVAGCDAMLHVIDASNGNGLAKIELSSQTAVAPTMLGSLAYFGMESGEFVCADMEDKKIVWTWKDERQDAAIRGSAAVTDTSVIFGSRGSRVICLDRKTGEVKWTYRSKRPIDASALVVGDRVYLGDTAGNFMVLDVNSGELVQSIELSGGIMSAPCLTGDRLLLTTQEGIVYCLGAKP